MKNIAFFGTCQLQRIGQGVEQMAAAGAADVRVVWNTPFFETPPMRQEALFTAFEEADIIYAQWDGRPDGWSVSRLASYFPLKLVPTLLSYVSRPQLDFFGGAPAPPESLPYVDMRMLQLYLAGVAARDVAARYSERRLRPDAVESLIESERAKYARRFEAGQIAFDYAPVLVRSLRADSDAFLTPNHPRSGQLMWLFNEIVRDFGGEKIVTLPPDVELLDGWRVPSLHPQATEHDGTYMMNCQKHRFETAAKLFYYFFDAVPPDELAARFKRSVYGRMVEESDSAIAPTPLLAHHCFH